jgi:DNA polymerase IV
MGTYTSDISRQVLHMDLDTFFVSVERLLDPALNKKPVIVGGSPFERGVVAGCSYEARTFGIHSAMPLRQAYRLCPTAIFMHGHYAHYGEYSRLVSEILNELAPQIEKSSVDEFYLDLSGCERLKGNTYSWAKEIQRTVNGETHLPLSIGLAANKLVAKIATTQFAKKDVTKAYIVEGGTERQFLSPLPIRAMPGIGEATEQILLTYGMHHIGQIAQTPIQLLQKLFGKTGKKLHEHANGIDLSSIVPSREQKSISRETTFAQDTFEVDKIVSTLHALATDLAEELRSQSVMAGRITVKLRYSDFTTVTRGLTISFTTVTQEIYRIAEKLLRSLWTRRVRIRLIGIEAGNLIEDFSQLFLFNIDEKKNNKLDSILDTLNLKYGDKSLVYASHLMH